MPSYDYSALTRPMPWSEVTATKPWLMRDAVAGVAVALVWAVIALWHWFGPAPDLDPAWRPVLGVLLGILSYGGIPVALAGLLLAGELVWARRERRIRLFAADNGFSFHNPGVLPPATGQIFGAPGITAAIGEQLTSDSGVAVRSRTGQRTVSVTIGNAALTAEPQPPRTSTTSLGRRGYVHVGLTRPSPHYLLDAKANNLLGSARAAGSVRASQHLSLEGDFDRYFALYCAPGREREALQLFTPDLMALLIDHGRAWDVEVVGDDLFVYSTRELHLHDADEMRRLLTFVDRVVPSLGGRVERMRPSEEATTEALHTTRTTRVHRSLVVLLAVFGLSLAVLAGVFAYAIVS